MRGSGYRSCDKLWTVLIDFTKEIDNIMEKNMLYLNKAQVESLVPSEKVLELVEKSFEEYSLGYAVNPVKLHLPIYPDYEGYVNSMPAYLRRMKIAGAKIVSVFKDNPRKGLPATAGLVLLHDVETGIPYAVMDGTYITSARTGAVMGVMAKYLAKKDSKVLTVIGTGAQGLSSFNMIQIALKSIEEVRLVDISTAAQEHFVKGASELYPNVNYVKYPDITSACKGSDIILAAATSDKPLLLDEVFDKGTTVLIVEDDITSEYVNKFDSFIADFKECLVERVNSDILHHSELLGVEPDLLEMDSVTGEIGDIITGKIPGRQNDEQIIMASSVGMGIQDIIVAREAYDKAHENNIGINLNLL